MGMKKAAKVDLRSAEYERTAKYFLRFFRGNSYFKILAGNSHVAVACGCFFFPKPYPLAFHEELEIMYVRQGRGAYYLAGKIYPLRKRLLLIAKPNEIHAMMKVPLHEKAECGCFVFPLGWLGMDLDVKSWPHELFPGEEEAARLELICGQVSEEVKNQGPGHEDLIRVKVQEICCLVRRVVGQPRKLRAHPLVDQMREYVDQHFAESTSVLDISKGFGYTGRHLEGEFKKSTGVSLKRYILQRRVMEARVMLETKPELKIAAIARQVGFEDYRLFHRIFKILAGVRPEEYRHVMRRR